MASAPGPSRRRLTDYTVACICPMGVELAPVEAMLDVIHKPPPTLRDQNAYTLGEIGGHNVAIAIMPEMGGNAAATTATQLMNDFPSIRFALLVGVGGGIPTSEDDIRLGDVVVGQPNSTFGGVVQYDMGKVLAGRRFQRIGSLNKPPAVLSANVRRLDGQHRRLGNNLAQYISDMFVKYPKMEAKYCFPTDAPDQLFVSDYEHQPGRTCDSCDKQQVIERPVRQDNRPGIHYGTIGSANAVVKDAIVRDELQEDMELLCIEMEAAGLMNDFPCLVIRGIAAYADSHKNKRWQSYAAAVAAAYMKELLLMIPMQQVKQTEQVTATATATYESATAARPEHARAAPLDNGISNALSKPTMQTCKSQASATDTVQLTIENSRRYGHISDRTGLPMVRDELIEIADYLLLFDICMLKMFRTVIPLMPINVQIFDIGAKASRTLTLQDVRNVIPVLSMIRRGLWQFHKDFFKNTFLLHCAQDAGSSLYEFPLAKMSNEYQTHIRGLRNSVRRTRNFPSAIRRAFSLDLLDQRDRVAIRRRWTLFRETCERLLDSFIDGEIPMSWLVKLLQRNDLSFDNHTGRI